MHENYFTPKFVKTLNDGLQTLNDAFQSECDEIRTGNEGAAAVSFAVEGFIDALPLGYFDFAIQDEMLKSMLNAAAEKLDNELKLLAESI